VRGQSEGVSTTGIGVLGYSGPSGPTTLGYANSGVYGISMVNGGNGVVGEADNGSGAYGVWGTSAAGIGGFFNGGSQGVYGYSPLAYGGYFSGGSYGVFGSGSSGTGGYFSGGTNGVYGISSGGSGGRFSGTSYGLFSTASVGSGGYFSGNVYGVYSVASAGYGGSFSGTTYGVSANASAGTGGNFSGSANGVTATGGSIGVIGNSTSTGVQGNGYNGVWGVATSNGNGVWGQADIGTSAYAVYGTSANGYGGYFSGGAYGIYGLGATYLSYDSSLSRANLEIHDTGIGNYARLRLSSSSYPYWDIAVGGGANVMNFYNNTNGNVMSLTAGGDLSVATITIRGGADVAEPFQMSHQDIPKGAVVIIDAKHPGQLKLSERAYDTRVAGIVSGANGIQPGLSLHQEGAIAGGQNVALTGRVYVQADASNGPIQPGDLLTTSDIPGYAMKVTDHTRAQGAILGKAMTELPEGKGNVLVLVTLQ